VAVLDEYQRVALTLGRWTTSAARSAAHVFVQRRELTASWTPDQRVTSSWKAAHPGLV
jgi:hypothetical protein